mmetsp:Transcript_5375/g.10285  ORF Transcript_5375/g.10285 Transcript_5375/m.10285 type:complete len:434 (-) Transcript_5375:428-1729(-)
MVANWGDAPPLSSRSPAVEMRWLSIFLLTFATAGLEISGKASRIPVSSRYRMRAKISDNQPCPRPASKPKNQARRTSFRPRVAFRSRMFPPQDEIQGIKDLTDDAAPPSMDGESVFVSITAPRTLSNFRNVTAAIRVNADPKVVWDLLTDYDQLAEIVPSLASNHVLERWEGGARVYQVGEQRLFTNLSSNFAAFTPNAKFTARCTLDCEEVLRDFGGSEPSMVQFKMVDGDFEEFRGVWSVVPLLKATGGRETRLVYNLGVRPSPFLPVALIERRLASDVRANLAALRAAAESVEQGAARPGASRTVASRAAAPRRSSQPQLTKTTRGAPSRDNLWPELDDLFPVDLAPPSFVPYLLSRTSVGRAVGTLPVPVPKFLVPVLTDKKSIRKSRGWWGIIDGDFLEWVEVREIFGEEVDRHAMSRRQSGNEDAKG